MIKRRCTWLPPGRRAKTLPRRPGSSRGWRSRRLTAEVVTGSSPTGLYFVDCNPVEPSPLQKDPALAARLWQVSVELTRPYLS
jgi:hypothetical protein